MYTCTSRSSSLWRIFVEAIGLYKVSHLCFGCPKCEKVHRGDEEDHGCQVMEEDETDHACHVSQAAGEAEEERAYHVCQAEGEREEEHHRRSPDGVQLE